MKVSLLSPVPGSAASLFLLVNRIIPVYLSCSLVGLSSSDNNDDDKGDHDEHCE